MSWPGTPRRRKLTTMVAAGVIGVLLTGALVVAAEGPGNPGEPAKLQLVMDQDTSTGQRRIQLIEQWNKIQRSRERDDPLRLPEVQVTELPGSATRWHSEILARMQSKTPVDVLTLDATWTAEFVEGGHIREIDRTAIPDMADFLANPLRTCRYQGRLYALPFNTDVGLLYYDKRGPDVKTLDDVFRQLSSSKDGEIDPYVGQYGDGEAFSVNAMEILEIKVSDNRVEIGEESYRRLQNFFILLGDQDRRRRLMTYDEAASRDRFSSGNAMFMRNWPVAYQQIKELWETEDSNTFPLGVASLPYPMHGVLGGQNLAISATSTQPEVAQRLIEFLTNPASQQLLLEEGGFAATRRSVYYDPRVAADEHSDKPSRIPPDVLLDAIENAKLRPAEQYYERFSLVLREQLRPPLDDETVKFPKREKLEESLSAALTGRR